MMESVSTLRSSGRVRPSRTGCSVAVRDACSLRKPGLVCFACFFLEPFPLLCMPLASAGYPGILAEDGEAEVRTLLDADDWEEIVDGESGLALPNDSDPGPTGPVA